MADDVGSTHRAVALEPTRAPTGVADRRDAHGLWNHESTLAKRARDSVSQIHAAEPARREHRWHDDPQRDRHGERGRGTDLAAREPQEREGGEAI